MKNISKLKGGYFGTRKAEYFTDEFMKRIAPASAFIDITAGTGQFPYRYTLETGKPVGLIERCDYVGLLLKSVFDPKSAGFPAIQKSWIKGRKGYLSKTIKTNERLGKIFHPEAAAFLDGVMLSDSPDGFKHSVMRVMGRTYFFRSRNWCPRTPRGQNTIEVKPPQLMEAVERQYAKLADLRGELKSANPEAFKRNEVIIGDTSKHLSKLKLTPGAAVYCDPAWPYAKEFGGGNPYKFLYEETGSIIRQESISLPEAWEVGEQGVIFTDLARWIDHAFKGGASQFILCTQDTNYPTPDDVEKWVRANRRLAHKITIKDWSSSAHREYNTYWYFIKR